jgi:hypothetical protein
LTTNHSDQPGDQTAIILDEAPIEKQHPVTEAICTKQERPVSAEYSSQPEDKSTITNPNESVAKKQRMTDHPPVEEQVIEEQKRHSTAPREELRPMKRSIAADYFNHCEGRSWIA